MVEVTLNASPKPKPNPKLPRNPNPSIPNPKILDHERAQHLEKHIGRSHGFHVVLFLGFC